MKLIAAVLFLSAASAHADPTDLKVLELVLGATVESTQTAWVQFNKDINDLDQSRGREKRQLKRSICPTMKAIVGANLVALSAALEKVNGLNIDDTNTAGVNAAVRMKSALELYVAHSKSATEGCATNSSALQQTSSDLASSSLDLNVALNEVKKLETALTAK